MAEPQSLAGDPHPTPDVNIVIQKRIFYTLDIPAPSVMTIFLSGKYSGEYSDKSMLSAILLGTT